VRVRAFKDPKFENRSIERSTHPHYLAQDQQVDLRSHRQSKPTVSQLRFQGFDLSLRMIIKERS
jgi:hypothetical protein